MDVHRVAAANEDRSVALIVLFVNHRFLLEVHRRVQGVLIVHHIRVLLDLDLGKVDRKGLEHTELQIKIARAAGGDYDTGDAVFTLFDLELLEIAEFDRACHIRSEAVGHKVIPACNGGIVAFQLYVPRLSVGLRGGKAIYAVDHLPASRHVVSFKLGAKQGVLHTERRHLSRVYRRGTAVRRKTLESRTQLRHLRALDRLLRHSRHSFLRLLCLRDSLAAAREQKRQQENNRDHDFRAFHTENLLV